MSLEHDVNGMIKEIGKQDKIQKINEVKDHKTITIEELKKLKECGGKKRKIKERNFGETVNERGPYVGTIRPNDKFKVGDKVTFTGKGTKKGDMLRPEELIGKVGIVDDYTPNPELVSVKFQKSSNISHILHAVDLEVKECNSKKRKIKERNFGTKEEFIEYLRNTLIPDLIASGNEATAEDFEEAIEWMGGEPGDLLNEPEDISGPEYETPPGGVDIGEKKDSGDVGEKIHDIATEALRDLAYIRDHDIEVGASECDAVIKKVQQIKKLIYK